MRQHLAVTTIAAMLLAGCAGMAQPQGEEPAAGQGGGTPLPSGATLSEAEVEAVFSGAPRDLFFACPDGFSFLAEVSAEEAMLELPEGSVALPALGGSYGQPGYLFVPRDGLADLERPGYAHSDCRARPDQVPWERARLEGVTLRAVGQEPGWWLEIGRGDSLELATDYGARREIIDAPAPEAAGGDAQVYRAPQLGLTVTIAERECVDIMSGRSFPLSVALETPRGPLRGCGRRLS